MTIWVSVPPLLIFKELKQVLTDTHYINVLEIMSKEIKVYTSPWDLANEMYPEIDKEIIDEMLFCEITELITNYEKIDI